MAFPTHIVAAGITNEVYRYRFEKYLNFHGRLCYSSYVTKPEFKVLTERDI